MPAKTKSASERHAEEVQKFYANRLAEGLPAHRVQEHTANPDGATIKTVGGVCYISFAGGEEQALDQTQVFELIKQLQAAFQAIS